MDIGRRPLVYGIHIALLGVVVTPLAWTESAIAQTVGPGTVTTPVNVASGTTTVVGSTTINVKSGTGTPSTTHATNVTGGTLILDMQAGTRPGPISVLTDSGNALYANGGAIQVPSGINITTTRGAALYADGAASAITLNGGIVTSLGGGYAAVARNGATVTINSTNFSDPWYSGASAAGNGLIADAGGVIQVGGGTSSMSTSGATNQVALGASGAGSAINVTSPFVFSGGLSGITMNGLGSLGIYLYNGGAVTLSRPQAMVFNGASSVGVTVDGTTMAAPLSGLTLNFQATSGVGGTGVVVMNGGNALLDSLTIAGPAAALGVWTQQGTAATLTGTSTININAPPGRNGQSWRLTSGSLVNGIFGSVSAPSWRAGLLNLGGVIDATGLTVNANAAGSYGAYAGTNGSTLSSVRLANATINAIGSGSIGLAGYASSRYDVSSSAVSANGGVAALYLYGYATASQPASFATTMGLTNTTVAATGSAYGLWSTNWTLGQQTNAIDISGGQFTADYVAIGGEGPLNVNVSNGASISGGAWLLSAEGNDDRFGAPTVINLSATHSTLSGLVEADAASQANVSLADASVWTGKAFYASNVTTDSTSEWLVSASSLVSGMITNAGLIQFAPPDAGVYKSLYTGSWSGSGTLGVHTYLGDDASPTDRLIIDGGTATGSSRIAVTNSGGPGAETSGNGILLVQVANGGTTADGAFALSAPVIAGPYQYFLHRGGASPGTENDWFLRNTVTCIDASTPGCAPAPEPPAPPDPPAPPPPAPPPPAPAPAPDPSNPPAPTPAPPAPPVPDPVVPEENGTPEPVAPVYRPEVSLYSALPAMALRYGWAMLGNLHERVGEEEQLRGRSDLREDNYLNALWVRVIGEDGNVRGASQGIYNGGPQYDYNIMGFQAGMDVFAEEHDNQQRDHAGLYLGTGRIRSDVTNYDGTDAGDDIVKGQSLGLYWTHFWTEGQYLDAVWQGTWSKYSAKSDEGLELHHNGFGWAASLEGGYPFHDDSQVWEPQAQVIYQRANNGQSSDAAAEIRFSDITSLVGRLGLRWANTWTQDPAADGSPRLFTGWLRFNLWKEFKGQPTTSFSSEEGFVPFDGSIKGSWWQLNGGMTWELDKNTSFYANVGYQKGFGSRGFHAWDAKVGFRWNW